MYTQRTKPRVRPSAMTMLAMVLAALVGLTALVPATVAAQDPASVNLRFDGLEPLADTLVYEGWLIIDGAPQSTGTFNIDADGNIDTITSINVADAESASAFVLSIEPANDPDPAPAATKILGGEFNGFTASLGIDHPAAVGTDFSDAAGEFIIATPTTADDSDDLSGVLFLDPTGDDGPAPSLDLPTLNDGWVYEGWVVIDGTPISTGRFTSATGADDFGGFSGDQDAPPFPGEDFIVNAPAGLEFPTDLSGRTVVISVEPEPDDSTAPFALKPLVGDVPADVEVGALNALGDGPVAITGTATITGDRVALATTGADSWLLAIGAVVIIAAGAALVVSTRERATI